MLDSGTFIVNVNAGPSQYAGKQRHPHFFSASFQNDTAPKAMGLYMQNKGIKRVYLMAPNYPAGKDFLAGFKRYFKGEIVDEVYTAFGQLDYAAEIAQLRDKKPDAVFFFYPGGMGIHFVKQYAQASARARTRALREVSIWRTPRPAAFPTCEMHSGGKAGSNPTASALRTSI